MRLSQLIGALISNLRYCRASQQRAVDFVGKGNLFTGCHDARPGLERSETPEFFNMAHPTLRGFLKTSMPIGFVVLNQRL